MQIVPIVLAILFACIIAPFIKTKEATVHEIRCNNDKIVTYFQVDKASPDREKQICLEIEKP